VSSFGPLVQEEDAECGRVQQRDMIRGLEQMFYKEMLKEIGLFALANRRLRIELPTIY